MKIVFEARPATPSEKAHRVVYDPETGLTFEPRYLGVDEANARIPQTVYPCVYVAQNNYIPVRFRGEKFLIR